LRQLGLIVVGLLLALGGITLWALEWDGVAVVETRDPSGGARSTHVWFAEPNGELWLEAGTPENPWFRDVQKHPELVFRTDRGSERYTAEPLNDPEGHPRIRSLMREKYGFRDVWVGWLFDTSHSIAVRLRPEAS
jgi:hypothetical protein